jgi:hypothetical protein
MLSIVTPMKLPGTGMKDHAFESAAMVACAAAVLPASVSMFWIAHADSKIAATIVKGNAV